MRNLPRLRAFYRGYHARSGRRAAQVRRLHIIREHDGPHPGRQGWCGAAGWAHTDSAPIVLDPMPTTPPAGLAWCPLCFGRAAEQAGLLDAWARQMAATQARPLPLRP